MKSGYRVVWTDHALIELRQAISYLEQNFSDREIQQLASKIESTLSLIATQPAMYPESPQRKGVRRVVIMRFNTLYYRVEGQQIEVISFFSNRQDAEKVKL